MTPMQDHEHARRGHYGRLLAMTLAAFASMYVLMYAMTDTFGNVYSNLNQVYMVGLMTASMVIIDLLLMGKMYPDRTRNVWIMVAAVVVLGLCWILMRQQVGITERQFLRSMIPHHAGAILMCEQSTSTSPDIVQLCQKIVSSQRSEIALMKSLLEQGK